VGAEVIAIAVAALTPWAALLPLPGTLGLASAVLAAIAAFHGWGAMVRRFARTGEAPIVLVVHWGLAVLLSLAGVALLLHQLGHTVQLGLVISGLALHSGFLVVERQGYAARVKVGLRSPDRWFWLVPAIGVVLVAMLHVLGTAADLNASPFDDDGNVPAQLQRLWETGALADPVGYARSSQFGGHITASALVTALTGTGWFRVVDGLGFVLLLWNAIAYLRPRAATTSLWAVLLILAAASYPFVSTDATPRWLATSLLFALFVTFERYAAREDDRELWPLGLLAGTVAVLRSELVPVGVAMLASAGLLAIGRSGGKARTFALFVVPAVAILPYVLGRYLSRSSVPGAVLDRAHGVGVPLLVFIALVVVAVWFALAILRGPSRWIAIAALAGVAAIVAQLTGQRPYAVQMVWPIVVGGGLAIGVGGLRDTPTAPRDMAVVLALLAAVLIYDGRDATGRVRWSRRYSELASGIEYVRHAYPSPLRPSPYAALLAKIPPGARVAVWVARPELVSARLHMIYDLRTPRSAGRRVPVLRALEPDYLLLEADHLPAERSRRSLWHRLACPEDSSQAFCLDDLDSFVSGHAVVATEGIVRLVRLAP